MRPIPWHAGRRALAPGVAVWPDAGGGRVRATALPRVAALAGHAACGRYQPQRPWAVAPGPRAVQDARALVLLLWPPARRVAASGGEWRSGDAWSTWSAGETAPGDRCASAASGGACALVPQW